MDEQTPENLIKPTLTTVNGLYAYSMFYNGSNQELIEAWLGESLSDFDIEVNTVVVKEQQSGFVSGYSIGDFYLECDDGD